MKKIILILVVTTLTLTFSNNVFSAASWAGRGLGGKTLELRASGGYVPYAKMTIKDKPYEFYYTGTVVDGSLTYFFETNAQSGIYVQHMNLENTRNKDSDKETMTVTCAGFNLIGSLPIAIRPYIELGVGVSRSEIKQTGASTANQEYRQGFNGRLALGLAPRIAGIGFYIKGQADYVEHDDGRDKDDSTSSLFKVQQFSYNANFGLQIAL